MSQQLTTTIVPTASRIRRSQRQHRVAMATPARRLVTVLGVTITDVTKRDALRLLEEVICAKDSRCHSVFIVNAHTLNLATEQPDYRHVLNSGDLVFNDGTGVRWAAKQRGFVLRDNLVGTDLIPDFFQATAGRGYRYFLLGAAPDVIAQAAAAAEKQFAGWSQAGFRHGFLNGNDDDAIDRINATKPDVLLVGMGNPIQERWITRHKSRLHVPLVIGVGGLFDHWIGRPKRAPMWVRRMGCEWMHKLLLQPHKWRRYLIGNPQFLLRMTISKERDVAAMQSRDQAALTAIPNGSQLLVG
jgi:N-acetylglucosaminyldiphosphoundecaprenol N-acetyl-beta-D-mannosaminyltransferase